MKFVDVDAATPTVKMPVCRKTLQPMAPENFTVLRRRECRCGGRHEY